MNLKSILFVFFVFIFTFTVASCSPGQTFGPTSSPSPTITATLTPTQTDTPTPEPTATPSLLQGQLSGLAAAPDMLVDSAGLHITLPDSSRVIDIAPGDVGKEVVFDSDYNLYKIYDAKGNITAEYDPGQGMVGDANYVPSTGWVDVQKLAKDLVCQMGDSKTCLNYYSNQYVKNSAWFEFSSAGIFRYKDVVDNITGKTLGKLSLLEVISRDKDQNPSTAWFLVQAETSSANGINKFRVITQTHFMNEGLGINGDGGKIFSPIDFITWIPKGSAWSYSFLRSGKSYSDFLTGNFNGPADVNAANFISSGGMVTARQNIILSSNGS